MLFKGFNFQKVFVRASIGFVLGATILCISATYFASLLHATESSPPIQAVHIPPDSKSIPPVASMMTLTLELKNSKATDLKIRLVASRDGKFMDVAMPSGQLNPSDQATYQIQVPSPIAAITYQFIIQQPDGVLTTTPRFTARRNCIQNFKVDPNSGLPDADFRKEVGALIAKARLLERETANYESALKIIDDIKQTLNQ